jgi:hypothetical protein
MSHEETDLRTLALLSLQRALWGMITPDIRAVAVGWGPGIVRSRFLYDHAPTEDDWEAVREVETEVISDLPVDVTTVFTADFVPQGKPALSSDEEWWAYMRRED